MLNQFDSWLMVKSQTIIDWSQKTPAWWFYNCMTAFVVATVIRLYLVDKPEQLLALIGVTILVWCYSRDSRVIMVRWFRIFILACCLSSCLCILINLKVYSDVVEVIEILTYLVAYYLGAGQPPRKKEPKEIKGVKHVLS